MRRGRSSHGKLCIPKISLFEASFKNIKTGESIQQDPKSDRGKKEKMITAKQFFNQGPGVKLCFHDRRNFNEQQRKEGIPVQKCVLLYSCRKFFFHQK